MADPLTQVRVVKIGGSLLEFQDLQIRIDQWVDCQLPRATVWIVGGGILVDEIRKQRPRNQSPEEIHWNCIRRMNDNVERVANMFPQWIRIDRVETELLEQSVNFILSPFQWCRDYATHLPMNWDVTSDSISAALAQRIGAIELVLLKSSDPPFENDIEAAIENGFVDRYFQKAINGSHDQSDNAGFAVRVVNLRSTTFSETVWR